MSKVLLLSDAVVASVLEQTPLRTLLASQEDAFRLYSSRGSRGKSWEAPLRMGVTTPRFNHLFMPGRIHDRVSIKCVATPSPSAAKTTPGIPGTGLVFDSHTAKVSTILNQTRLTAVRTAVGCLAAAKRVVGPPERIADGSRRLVIFGTGAQAIWHARVFSAYYSHIEHVHFIGRSAAGTEKGDAFLKEARETMQAIGRDVSLSLSTYQDEDVLYKEAGAADLLCCCTPSTQALFEWGRYNEARKQHGNPDKRAHFSMVGSYKPDMQEVPTELIQQAARDGALYVDSLESCAHEAGDLIKAGIESSGCVEIGTVLDDAGKTSDATPTPSISVFKSVGVAVQDVSITQMVVEEARRKGLGQWVDF